MGAPLLRGGRGENRNPTRKGEKYSARPAFEKHRTKGKPWFEEKAPVLDGKPSRLKGSKTSAENRQTTRKLEKPQLGRRTQLRMSEKRTKEREVHISRQGEDETITGHTQGIRKQRNYQKGHHTGTRPSTRGGFPISTGKPALGTGVKSRRISSHYPGRGNGKVSQKKKPSQRQARKRPTRNRRIEKKNWKSNFPPAASP